MNRSPALGVFGALLPGVLNFPKMKEGRKEVFYLTTHSTHFIYGHMASDAQDIHIHGYLQLEHRFEGGYLSYLKW